MKVTITKTQEFINDTPQEAKYRVKMVPDKKDDVSWTESNQDYSETVLRKLRVEIDNVLKHLQ